MLKYDRFRCSIILTNACDIDCAHCFLKNDRDKNVSLSKETVYKVCDRLMEMAKDVDINWGGGEPLKMGVQFFEDVVKHPVFSEDRVKNSLFSSLQVKDFRGSGWKDILNLFHAITFSLDLYRQESEAFDLNLAIGVLKNIKPKINISYSPSPADNYEMLRDWYLTAIDLNASVFHLGLIYDDKLFPVEMYMERLDWLDSLHAKYNGPRIGFYPSESSVNTVPCHYDLGWRAYDCLVDSAYVYGDRVTSCYICQCYGLGNPSISVSEFIGGKDITYETSAFVHEHLSKTESQCSDCEYYTVCIAGCPFFASKSPTGKDFYCDLYKKIFKRIFG